MLATLALVEQSPADLLVKGEGRNRVLVREQFTPAQRVRYDLFAVKCTKCHAMGRIIDALRWGYTPITGSDFDEAAIRRYVIKMMRKRNSSITKRDARVLTDFLLEARKLAEKPPARVAPEPAPAPAPAPTPAPARDGGPP